MSDQSQQKSVSFSIALDAKEREKVHQQTSSWSRTTNSSFWQPCAYVDQPCAYVDEDRVDHSYYSCNLGEHKVGDVILRISLCIFPYAGPLEQREEFGICFDAVVEPSMLNSEPISSTSFSYTLTSCSHGRGKELSEISGECSIGSKVWAYTIRADDVMAHIESGFDLEVTGEFDLSLATTADNSPWLGMRVLWQDLAELSDFVIVARGGKEIPCHKVVLAGASPVMRKMLSAGMEEGRQGFNNIDEREDVLRALLQYMYVQSLPPDVDQRLLLSLIRLADYYQVAGLPAMCTSRLLPLMKPHKFLETMCALEGLRHVNEACERAFLLARERLKRDDELLHALISEAWSKADVRFASEHKEVVRGNIVEVLGALKLVRQVNETCERAFLDVTDMVKRDYELLDEMLAVAMTQEQMAPKHDRSGCVFETGAETLESKLFEQPCHNDQTSADLPVIVGGDIVESVFEYSPSIDCGKQPGSGKSQEGSETGPGHAKSGSSERSAVADAENKEPQSKPQIELRTLDDLDCDPQANGLAPLTIGSPSRQPLEACSDTESGAGSDDAAALPAATSASNDRPSGPRRKTRRGKTGGRNRRLDQSSIPDTHNSWD